MKIVKTTIETGAEKPFSFLHMTDTHLTRTDDKDSIRRKDFAKDRKSAYFPSADEDIEFAKEYSKKTGLRIVHTGDIFDFITPENLRVASEFAKSTNMLFVAGNHEIHTCPNDVFCDEDFKKDLENKQTNLANTNSYFPNDIDYFCEEVNGVYLVGINNYDYQISEANFSRLKELSKKGKPIILFMHIPLYQEALFEKMDGALLAIPDSIIDTKREFLIFEQKADEITKQAAEFIKSCPEIKCTVCGHLHFDFESPEGSDIKQYITGINSLREITVE